MDQNKNQPGVTLEKFQDVINRDTPPLLQKIVANLKPILIGAAVLVALAATVAGFRMLQARNLAGAQEALGSILVSTNGKDKIAALEKFLPEAPSALRGAVLFELAGASMAVEDYAKAVDSWQQLVSVSKGDAKLVASLGHARALVLAGKPADAVKELSALKPNAPEAFKAPLDRQLGLAAEAAGDRATALAAYGDLLQSGEAGDKPYIESKIAQLKAAN